MNENRPFACTVVMPALNEENNIGAAIDDTLAAFAAYGVDGELLVINDGSTDATAEIVRRKIPGS